MKYFDKPTTIKINEKLWRKNLIIISGNVGRHVRSHVRMLAHMQIDLHVRHIARASCCYFKVDHTCKKNLFYSDMYIILKLFICSLKLEILLLFLLSSFLSFTVLKGISLLFKNQKRVITARLRRLVSHSQQFRCALICTNKVLMTSDVKVFFSNKNHS